MNRLILNIGLNVGETEPANQLGLTLLSLQNRFISFMLPIDIKVSENFGSWGKERVLVLEMDTYKLNIDGFKSVISLVCTDLRQDGIAFTIDGEGYIVFNPNYKGEKFAFNPDYFKVFREENKKLTSH